MTNFRNLVGTLDKARTEYLKDLGFQEGTMSIIYYETEGSDKLKLGQSCYVLSTDIDQYKTLTVQINKYDIYYVYEYDYGSLIEAGRYDSAEYRTVEELEQLLDEIVRKISWY